MPGASNWDRRRKSVLRRIQTCKPSGKVVRISPTMDENERVLPVWVEVANPDHQLKDGMLARVTLLAEPASDPGPDGVARLVPIEATR